MKELFRRKSLLIVEADRLKAIGSQSGARAVYAEAAGIETRIAQKLRERGDREFYINAFSAASCWLEARRYDAAAAALNELRNVELPEAVDAEIEQTLGKVRRQQQPISAIRLLSSRREFAACSYPGPGDGQDASGTGPRWRGRPELAAALAA
ncbi:MAG: hypothetical protein HY318_16145 [Armatimonadetes bacterium]|nr:hypothetical protein [Armatimonadota bacterium]